MMENERAFPFDSIEDADGNPDRLYQAEDFTGYFAQFLGNGIYPNPATNLAVQSLNNNMVLTVQTGSAFINGYGYINKEPLQVALSTANGAYNRIDLIVVQLSHIDREIKVVYKEGVPSSNPVKPPLVRNDDVHELQLAQVTVKSGVQLVTQADILDTRLNGSVCGVVSAVVQSVDTTLLFQQYQTYLNQKIAEWNTTQAQQGTDFNNQMTAQQETFVLQLGEQQTEYAAFQNDFTGWFNGAKNEIATLQSFYFQNWAELNGCVYKDYPKDANGKYITAISDKISGHLIARQTEWRETISGTDCYMLKQEIFDTDGTTVTKTKTKKEYKDAAGVWIGEVM